MSNYPDTDFTTPTPNTVFITGWITRSNGTSLLRSIGPYQSKVRAQLAWNDMTERVRNGMYQVNRNEDGMKENWI